MKAEAALERNSSDTALYIVTQHKSNTGGGVFPVILSESITQTAHHHLIVSPPPVRSYHGFTWWCLFAPSDITS